MMTIWKYPLKVTDRQYIEIPDGAKPLKVMVQGDVPCLWALVDPNAGTTIHTVDIYGTGHAMPDHPGDYVDSFKLANGALVFHVFFPEGD